MPIQRSGCCSHASVSLPFFSGCCGSQLYSSRTPLCPAGLCSPALILLMSAFFALTPRYKSTIDATVVDGQAEVADRLSLISYLKALLTPSTATIVAPSSHGLSDESFTLARGKTSQRQQEHENELLRACDASHGTSHSSAVSISAVSLVAESTVASARVVCGMQSPSRIILSV